MIDAMLPAVLPLANITVTDATRFSRFLGIAFAGRSTLYRIQSDNRERQVASIKQHCKDMVKQSMFQD
jgi:hypothetical protein